MGLGVKYEIIKYSIRSIGVAGVAIAGGAIYYLLSFPSARFKVSNLVFRPPSPITLGTYTIFDVTVSNVGEASGICEMTIVYPEPIPAIGPFNIYYIDPGESKVISDGWYAGVEEGLGPHIIRIAVQAPNGPTYPSGVIDRLYTVI